MARYRTPATRQTFNYHNDDEKVSINFSFSHYVFHFRFRHQQYVLLWLPRSLLERSSRIHPSIYL